MKTLIPELEFSSSPETIKQNRKLIEESIAVCKATLKSLGGLHAANISMCTHPCTVAHHDPGYAGGGYSHSECLDCGGRC